MHNLKQSVIKEADYLEIAYKRYLAFKETPAYEEAYKLKILSELNDYLHINSITPESVGHLARKLQKENPTSGSFVHWSNTDDLAKFAEANPDVVSELWNQLYDSSISIEDRISQFRAKGKAFNPTISLGAPLFGYLLAAYDYTRYPLYKEEVYKDLKKTYGIDTKFGTVSKNYSEYIAFAEEVLVHLQRTYLDLTMLDVQDFFFCSTQYDKIIVESAVEYLYGMAQELNAFREDPSMLLEFIKNMGHDSLEELKKVYRNSEKVNKIKLLVIENILDGKDLTVEDLEQIKTEVKVQYDTNILHSWTNFTILFQLFYHHNKKKVREELRKLHETIIQFEELKGFVFTKGKTMNDFSWNQNFGGSGTWLAVYEENYNSHRSAPQLFIRVDEKGILYGLMYGSDHAYHGKNDIDHMKEVSQFNFEQFRQKMVEVSSSMQNIPGNETRISKEEWIELLEDKEIFKEKDKVYLFTLFELGGEAFDDELTKALGVHSTTLYTQMLALAKRIQHKIGLPVTPESSNETSCLNLLFDREDYQGGWKLNEELKETIAIQYEEKTVPTESVEVYSTEDFLQEVFMEEREHINLTSLLQYKKNIILQGPPGVGKTFVSKRLAYSLMGEKDDTKVEMVQFHQTYAYEDFVMGYRPGDNGFQLENGIFYEFCKRAEENPEKDYYFIIDEINRGNLSKIFGELFMLIERDKREEYVTMSYSKEKFTVPGNVYMIGTMNTADRSLAQLEVAFRRRFSFFTLEPSFNYKWQRFMRAKGLSDEMIDRVLVTVNRINGEIRNDFQLGRGYEIGHSFFTTPLHGIEERAWFETIMQFEIKPLLEEYFFDRPEVVDELLEGI
ncbi:AAA family ATPase [Halobacillus litoralis]|uniref:AAA family ATPase n=1 Tax=Halobacillus litoralis TaxID=45668 RepID=UPI0024900104|nr:AAA family ATPase [Halobacillus litoralis]